MNNSWHNRFLLSVVYAGACALLAPAVQAQKHDFPASHPFAQSRPVPGRYIVVFKSSVRNPAAEAARLVSGMGGQLHHTYSHALKGFAATLPDAALTGLRINPTVAYVEQDQSVALNQTSPQANATWGLDRIDQATLPLDHLYHFNATGAGVNAFIIDTGILASHSEFSGRAQPGQNFVSSGKGRFSSIDPTDTNDCNGHGTHVAGTVGGTTWGAAKGVSLIPVRVLDCAGSGTWSGVIAGIDWMAQSTARPAVANMSLGGGASMASPHVTGVAALARQANSGALPAAVALFPTANASANQLSSIGTGSPDLLLYSLVSGTPPTAPPPPQMVKVADLVGEAVTLKRGQNSQWRAYATVTVVEVSDDEPVAAGVIVNVSFAPGGSDSCVTTSTGSCTLSSASISSNESLTTVTIDSVSGPGLSYEPTVADTIAIPRP